MAIIKSLSRANLSFGSLYDYMSKEDEALLQAHNLYSDAYNRERIINEFLANAQFLQSSSMGKNFMYHEIISLKDSNQSETYKLNALNDLVSKYIEARANNHLVFSAIHKDKDNLHAHLMISANELNSQRRARLSKEQFCEIQKSLEEYQNQHYPDLKTEHYLKRNSNEKLKNSEQEMITNRGKISQKQQVKNELLKIFQNSKDFQEFESLASTKGFELYSRGNSDGVIYQDRKYRLKSLGLEEKLQFEKKIEFEDVAKNKEDILENANSSLKFESDKNKQEVYELTNNFQNSSFEHSMSDSNNK